MDDMLQRYLTVKDALSGRGAGQQKVHPGIGDDDVISLAQGNGMRRPHPSVILAGVRALLDGDPASVETYSSHTRFNPLDAAITTVFERFGIPGTTATQICLDSGATRLLAGFFHAVGQPGDVFLTGRAFYHGFASLAAALRVRLCMVETDSHDGHRLNAAAIREAVRREPRTKGLLLTSPTFTGEVYGADELAAIARVVEECGLLVFCDMTFAFTEHDGVFFRPTLASFAGMDRYVVSAMSGSKAFGLANIRIGWSCGPADIINTMNFYATANGLSVPGSAKAMLLAALNAPEEYLLANAREADFRKQIVLASVEQINDRLAGLGLSEFVPRLGVPHIPEACHSILVSFNEFRGFATRFGPIGNSVDVVRYLLDAAHVAISPCFSGGVDDCLVRIAFGDVGAEATYEQARYTELELVRARLLGTIAPELAGFPSYPDPGFPLGRGLLRQALVHRIGQALLDLVAHHHAPAVCPAVA